MGSSCVAYLTLPIMSGGAICQYSTAQGAQHRIHRRRMMLGYNSVCLLSVGMNIQQYIRNMATDIVNKAPMAMVPVGNLNAYIIAAYNIPVLAAEEERELAIRYREYDDLDAARKLVLHHLRFVIHVARGYTGYGLALEDLIQEGNVGLMKALKRFDPALGVRLVSFSVHWIRSEIHEFIIKNWRIVKIATTKAQRKLFFKLRSSKKRLGWMTLAEVNQVAKDLGVDPKVVLEMEKRLSDHEVSFDPLSTAGSDEVALAPSEWLASDARDSNPAEVVETEQWDNHYQHELSRAIGELDDRSRDILRLRWLSEKKTTLNEVAKKYDISPERVRQIEKQAIAKLKENIGPPD